MPISASVRLPLALPVPEAPVANGAVYNRPYDCKPLARARLAMTLSRKPICCRVLIEIQIAACAPGSFSPKGLHQPFCYRGRDPVLEPNGTVRIVRHVLQISLRFGEDQLDRLLIGAPQI